MVLGIWITVLPYLGFPYSLKNILYTISGLGLVGLSYFLYQECKSKEKPIKTFENFKENMNFKESAPEETSSSN